MALTPERDTTVSLFMNSSDKETRPSQTFAMDIHDKRLRGTIQEDDKRKALQQMIYKWVNTEKGEYIIYPTFGLRKKDCFGRPKVWAYYTLKGRIETELPLDDRIISVTDFYYDKEKSKRSNLAMRFKVNSIYGTMTIEELVNLNG